MARILIADHISPQGLELLEQARGFEIVTKLGLSEDQLCDAVKGMQGVLVRSAVKISRKIIESSNSLKIIGRAGVGVDNIDVKAATAAGILVVNSPFGNIVSAAEHTLGMLLSLARNIPAADHSLKSGSWERKSYVGTELQDKVLGILGYGRVGHIVAEVAKVMHMSVIANDPLLSEEKAREYGVRKVEFEEVIQTADFITIHTPLTEGTKHMIDRKALSRMKPGVRIVNCARGGIIDEKALAEALAEGLIAGAALDVFENEPATDSPLFKFPNVIVTPHLGASTEEAQVRVSIDVCRQFVDYFGHGRMPRAVNLPVTIDPALGRYITLAETLGTLAVQLKEGPVQKVEVSYCGEIAKKDTRPLGLATLMGLLRPSFGAKVNMINVESRANESNIRVYENKNSESRGYKSTVELQLKGAQYAVQVMGTLFDDNQLRITQINQMGIDFVPGPYMLHLAYPDKPGMLGKFGTVLGKHNINIGAMAVARHAPNQETNVLLNLDTALPDAALAEMKQVEGMATIHYIKIPQLNGGE